MWSKNVLKTWERNVRYTLDNLNREKLILNKQLFLKNISIIYMNHTAHLLDENDASFNKRKRSPFQVLKV
jgi:hypothetical protein